MASFGFGTLELDWSLFEQLPASISDNIGSWACQQEVGRQQHLARVDRR
jgi:hypothetical protein